MPGKERKVDEEKKKRLGSVQGKAHVLLAGADEIVWAEKRVVFFRPVHVPFLLTSQGLEAMYPEGVGLEHLNATGARDRRDF